MTANGNKTRSIFVGEIQGMPVELVVADIRDEFGVMRTTCTFSISRPGKLGKMHYPVHHEIVTTSNDDPFHDATVYVSRQMAGRMFDQFVYRLAAAHIRDAKA